MAPGTRKCPSCNEDNSVEATFCRFCMKPIGDYKLLTKCPYCGGSVTGGKTVCEKCEKKDSSDSSPFFYFVVSFIATAAIVAIMFVLERPWVNK